MHLAVLERRYANCGWTAWLRYSKPLALGAGRTYGSHRSDCLPLADELKRGLIGWGSAVVKAGFRDPHKTLDKFDFAFNPMNQRRLRRQTGKRSVSRPRRTGKSHLAQAIGQAAILQGYKMLYRQVHILLDELSTRKTTSSPCHRSSAHCR
ncbi:MAG TPA: ATP-binding protein [Bryobacteraceae bacterium]|nr:ATP-binding protein [Bryobacteraceae bacterium]